LPVQEELEQKLDITVTTPSSMIFLLVPSKTSNQNVISNKYSILIGGIWSTSTKPVLEAS